MKIILACSVVFILIILTAILGDKVQKECEKENGTWVTINGAGTNNTVYKCIRIIKDK
jgi:hypothetical protein